MCIDYKIDVIRSEAASSQTPGDIWVCGEGLTGADVFLNRLRITFNTSSQTQVQDYACGLARFEVLVLDKE